MGAMGAMGGEFPTHLLFPFVHMALFVYKRLA